MFSDELNQLIETLVNDGVLTEKEREVIHKRAILEGLDPDEVDLHLNAKVHDIQMRAISIASKLRTCSNCGTILQPGETTCSQCGQDASTASPLISPSAL